MTISRTINTKSSNKKQKSRFEIVYITKHHFRKFLRKFSNSPHLGYKSKQVHNETNESYFFLIKHITKLIKSNRRVKICTKFVKSVVNKNIRHVNKKIGHMNKAI